MKGKGLILFLVLTISISITGQKFGFCEVAEKYPSRTIQIIVPFTPGGLADLVGRPFASSLEKILNQPVAIINKPGAGGGVGIQVASVAKPDGYTLLVALTAISVMPEVDRIFGRPPTYKNEDFAPIARLTSDPGLFVVKKDAPWMTIGEFVADAKRRPKEIKYGSSGVYAGLHISMELFAHAAGISLRHIPTAGGGPALTALLGGHVDCLSSAPNVVYPHIRAGILRPLASTGDKRLAALPNIPTFKELGYDVEWYGWVGLFAPKATPSQVIKIIGEATRKAVSSMEFKTAMEKIETPIAFLDADEFQKFWDIDAKRVIEGVRRIGKAQ